MIPHNELVILKNLSCSPMSFATKILFKIFKIDELHGHNVSGKTLNKNLKAKEPLDPIRVGYIKYLVETYYDEEESKQMLCGVTSHKQDLWKSCHTAINKSILISERKAEAAAAQVNFTTIELIFSSTKIILFFIFILNRVNRLCFAIRHWRHSTRECNVRAKATTRV